MPDLTPEREAVKCHACGCRMWRTQDCTNADCLCHKYTASEACQHPGCAAEIDRLRAELAASEKARREAEEKYAAAESQLAAKPWLTQEEIGHMAAAYREREQLQAQVGALTEALQSIAKHSTFSEDESNPEEHDCTDSFILRAREALSTPDIAALVAVDRELQNAATKLLDDFVAAERSYKASLWTTGAGYILQSGYLQFKAAAAAKWGQRK